MNLTSDQTEFGEEVKQAVSIEINLHILSGALR